MRRWYQLIFCALFTLLMTKSVFAQAVPCDVNPQQPECIENTDPGKPRPKVIIDIRPVIDLLNPRVIKPKVTPKNPPKVEQAPRRVVVTKPNKPKKRLPVATKPAAVKKPAPFRKIIKPTVPGPSWLGLPETEVPVLTGSDFDDIVGQYLVDLDPAVFQAQGLDLETISLPALANLLGLQAAQIRSIQRVFMLSAVLRAPPEQAAALARNPFVRTVYADTKIKAMGAKQVPLKLPLPKTLPPLSWGLDRLDLPVLPLDGKFDRESGSYVARLYVLDSGIDANQNEFGGRVKWGARFAYPIPDTSGHCRDHGTEMASLIGGVSTGSAPKLEIIDVMVLPCSRYKLGQGSSLIEAAEWILLRERDIGDAKPVVVNMSLAGKWSRKINEAVSIMTRNNITVVAAAGNNAEDACRFSPASAKDAITVAATAPDDSIPGFSNYGACVDINAPGKLVTAVSEGVGAHYVAVSGTSGAAALVSGLLARSINKRGLKAAAQWLEESGVPQDLWLKSKPSLSSAKLMMAQMSARWRKTCRMAMSGVNLRERPGPNSRELGALAQNSEVLIEDTANGWVRILVGEKRGWLPVSNNGKSNFIGLLANETCGAIE